MINHFKTNLYIALIIIIKYNVIGHIIDNVFAKSKRERGAVSRNRERRLHGEGETKGSV